MKKFQLIFMLILGFGFVDIRAMEPKPKGAVTIAKWVEFDPETKSLKPDFFIKLQEIEHNFLKKNPAKAIYARDLFARVLERCNEDGVCGSSEQAASDDKLFDKLVREHGDNLFSVDLRLDGEIHELSTDIKTTGIFRVRTKPDVDPKKLQPLVDEILNNLIKQIGSELNITKNDINAYIIEKMR